MAFVIKFIPNALVALNPTPDIARRLDCVQCLNATVNY